MYSLSISPDGSRLASGGLDGKVRIWSVADILKYRDGTLVKDNTCKPLCSMSRHTGAVTVVKFSPDGRFLASGSDDKVLLIWEKDEEARPVFGEVDNVEHWTVTKRVVAHDNDIQDMAWAPDSSILVTVGLDRSIIIWNGSTFEKIKRFDVHQSHVKGVVFDPANKYFATSSDDRSIRIFRYHKGSEISFSIEKNVLQPFKKSPLTTYFRRLSWSPDGQHLAAPNATNGPVTSIAIINRGTWDSDISLIGHESPCEVASFSPILYESNENGETKISSTLATGGQDKTLVIWNTASSSPIVVFEDIFYKTITDLCWTPDGKTLFACSLDGTIAAIVFEESELGKSVPSNKTDEILNRYGVDKESMVFAESANQLILEEKAAEFQKTLSDKHMDRLLRIEQSTIQKPAPRPIPPPVSQPATPHLPAAPQQDPSKTKLNRAVLTNGKKRVAPTLISVSSASTHASNKFQNVTVSTKKVENEKAATNLLSKTPFSLPKFGLHTSVHGYFVKKVVQEDDEENEGDEIDDYEEDEDEEDEEDDLLYSTKKRKTKQEIPILQLQPSYDSSRLIYKRLIDGDQHSILEAQNYEDPEDDEPTIVRAKTNGKLMFETYLKDRITGITGEFDKYWILATDTCALLIYSPTGRMLCQRIELGYNISFMSCKADSLIVLTDDYIIHSYDLKRFKKLHKKVSLAPIMNYEQHIKERKVQITSQLADLELRSGQILAFMENNEVYLYNSDIRAWTKVVENFYSKYNSFNNIWVDRFKEPYITQKYEEQLNNDDYDHNDNKEFEYVTKLTFLESYRNTLKILNDGNTSSVIQELDALRNDPLYADVRVPTNHA